MYQAQLFRVCLSHFNRQIRHIQGAEHAINDTNTNQKQR